MKDTIRTSVAPVAPVVPVAYGITALRGERDKLKDALRRQLGQQLEQAAAGGLVTRVDELTRQNQQLTTERDALKRANAELAEKMEETEEAARTSLREVIRRDNN